MIRTITWTLPITYTDGTNITPQDQARVVTHILMDGTEIAVSLPGETTWSGETTTSYGGTYRFSVYAELDGQRSPNTPEVVFSVPFRVPSPPSGLTIL